jgi:hypothetical protein
VSFGVVGGGSAAPDGGALVGGSAPDGGALVGGSAAPDGGALVGGSAAPDGGASGHWLEICQLQREDIEFFSALVADSV